MIEPITLIRVKKVKMLVQDLARSHDIDLHAEAPEMIELTPKNVAAPSNDFLSESLTKYPVNPRTMRRPPIKHWLMPTPRTVLAAAEFGASTAWEFWRLDRFFFFCDEHVGWDQIADCIFLMTKVSSRVEWEFFEERERTSLKNLEECLSVSFWAFNFDHDFQH